MTDPVPSKDIVSRLRARILGPTFTDVTGPITDDVLTAVSTIENLRRENVRWENAHKILLAEIERLKRDLERAISNHSADLSSAPEPDLLAAIRNKAEEALDEWECTDTRAGVREIIEMIDARLAQPPGDGQ